MSSCADSGNVALTDLRCEYQVNPLGLGESKPRLSWRLRSTRRGAAQTACQVRVAATAEQLTQKDAVLWDSGRITMADSAHFGYAGPPLCSGVRYVWQVRIWDDAGAASTWSEPAWWEMGLLAPADWSARWIAPAWAEDAMTPQPSPLLRRDFLLDRPVLRARLYVTARGLYVCEINGRRVGDALLTPGWTSYHHRLLAQSYDVTDLLRPGANAIGAILGEGWYRGRIGAVGGRRCAYGDALGLLLQLVVGYTDGATTILTSDEHWQAISGPILAAGIYDGERYDARLAQANWSAPGGGDSSWQPVRVMDWPRENVVAAAAPVVRALQEITPVVAVRHNDSRAIYDMGENIAGWTRLAVQGEPGVCVALRHAEAIDAAGQLYTANLRSALQTDHYHLRGDGVEHFEPHFTVHGFRYVEVESSAPLLTPPQVNGIVIHSDLELTGSFACSDERLNRLQRNIVRSQRGNFIDIPTDCPQRDERLGWAGDAQVFAPTACFNMQCVPFFAKWLRDLAADQRPDGAYPVAAPMPQSAVEELSGGAMARMPVAVEPGFGVAGYSDAGVIVPWTLYLRYGERNILAEHYPHMVRWIENLRAKSGDDLIWSGWFQFGDWLALNAPTLNDLVATAYFAHAAHLVSQIADILGKKEDADRYADLWQEIRRAFIARFVQPDGRILPEAQTAYVLALAFDLLPQELRPAAAYALVTLVRARNNHLSTGFMGTPHLCRVLAEAGYLPVAYDLLLQESYPSWLYPLTMGATSIWERWNSIQPDGEFFHPAMNSFNHYAYGAIGDWLYRTVGGIDSDAAASGYRHVIVRPQPGGDLTWAHTQLLSGYGEIIVQWEIVDERFVLEVVVPPNTSAAIYLPVTGAVLESGLLLERSIKGIQSVEQSERELIVQVAAGRYRFDARYAPPASLPSPPPDLTYRDPRFTIHTSVSSLYADDHARAAVLAAAPEAADFMQELMERHQRHPYSLYQLAVLAPDLLTPQRLAVIDTRLAAL